MPNNSYEKNISSWYFAKIKKFCELCPLFERLWGESRPSAGVYTPLITPLIVDHYAFFRDFGPGCRAHVPPSLYTCHDREP